MTGYAHVYERDRPTWDFGALKTQQLEALQEMFCNWSRRKERMPIWCAEDHLGRMYLQKRQGALVACHYPGEGSCEMKLQHESQSAPHRNCVKYCGRSVDIWTPEYERTTKEATRPDITVSNARNPFSIEVQVSRIAVTKTQDRDRKCTEGGVPPIWVAFGNPNYAGSVPTLRHNDAEIAWDEAVPPRHTAWVKSIKQIKSGYCGPRGPFNRCPDTGRGSCYKWHPNYEPDGLENHAWSLDRALVALGTGELIRHSNNKGNVFIIPYDSIKTYRDITGLDGMYIPAGAKHSISLQQARRCTSQRKREFEYRDFCPICVSQFNSRPNSLWHPDSVKRGACERCWRDLQLNHMPYQLRLAM